MGRAYEVRKASIQKTGAAKARIYSTFAKEIYLAAKAGTPEIESNVVLKRIVDKAKKSQVPSDIIERAIDKAKGGSNEDYKEVVYEGFGPGQSTLIVKCLTDNTNRSISDVREAFNKAKCKMAGINAVSYNYDHLGVIGIKSNDEELIFDSLVNGNINVQDIENEDGIIYISVLPSDMSKTKDILEEIIPNIDYELDEIGMYAKEKITLSNEELEQFNKLLSLLNNVDDVSVIYYNVEL